MLSVAEVMTESLRDQNRMDEFLAEESLIPHSYHYVRIGKVEHAFVPPQEVEQLATSTPDYNGFLRHQSVMSLVRRLTLTQQRVVILHFLKGWNVKEIAKLERVCVGDIKLCLHCSIETMRSILVN